MEPKDVAGYLTEHQDELLSLVIRLAEINSGSLNNPGIAQVIKVLQEQFATINCEQTLMPVAPMQVINHSGKQEEFNLGPVLRCWKRPDAPMQVLLIGHMDTVFTAEHKFQHTERVGDKLRGPGVADMKGGLAVILWGLKAFEQLPQAQQLGWEVLLTSDEEIGSPGSAEIIANCAKKHTVAFVFEPAVDIEGNLAGVRKGSGKFTLVMHGKAAHVGRSFVDGRNAICKMAEVISKIDALNGAREGVVFNIGFVHGGEAVNVVPDTCMCRIDVRVPTSIDEDWVQNNLKAIVQTVNTSSEYRLELFGKFGRKPKQLDAETERLYKLVQRVGQQQGLQLTWHATGGVSDGNNLSAMGIPNVDTLGVVGEHIHSADEYVLIPSLVERAQLLTNILINLSESGFK